MFGANSIVCMMVFGDTIELNMFKNSLFERSALRGEMTQKIVIFRWELPLSEQ